MWGDYQVELLDIQKQHAYIPDGDPRYGHLVFMDVPSSVKGSVLITIRGTVRPQAIAAPTDLAPRTWSAEIQKTEQFPTLDNTTGFNVIAATKDTALEFTIETENETTKVDTDSHEFGLTLKAGGTIKIVEVEGEGAYKYTTTSETSKKEGDKTITARKYSVKVLDRQKQPKIVAVKTT